MAKYKATIAYDGSNYGGWQVQPNAVSIQSLIQKALATIFGEETHMTGSGRTDRGVHALGQVAHFITAHSFSTPKLLHSLNSLLPPDIRILTIEPAPDDFHARYSAVGKCYQYQFSLARTPQSPFDRLYTYHLPHPIDLEILEQASREFIGEHDFSSYSNEAHLGSAAQNPIRTLYRLNLKQEGETWALEFEGNGFLYKMVRNICGTLFDIARGKIPIEDIQPIFDAKDRCQAGACAPAHGLFLVHVNY